MGPHAATSQLTRLVSELPDTFLNGAANLNDVETKAKFVIEKKSAQRSIDPST